MSGKSIENELFEKEFWTQNEVADYFRVVPGTVKNWPDQGLLSYWQAPGSSKILYYRDEIKEFRDQNTTLKKAGLSVNRSCRDTRGTFITNALDANETMGFVQNQVGHSSIKPIVNHYYNRIPRVEDGQNLKKR
ncbi:MAG: hypothetical protein WAM73_02625 [Desulfobacterales bacterium]